MGTGTTTKPSITAGSFRDITRAMLPSSDLAPSNLAWWYQSFATRLYPVATYTTLAANFFRHLVQVRLSMFSLPQTTQDGSWGGNLDSMHSLHSNLPSLLQFKHWKGAIALINWSAMFIVVVKVL